MLHRGSVVACSPLVIVGMLDRGAIVAVGRAPVWFSGMFGYLILCFGCGMPFEFGWLKVRCGSVWSVNGVSKRGKESGNGVAGRVAFYWASGVRSPEIG